MVVCSSLGSVDKEEGHLQASLTTRQCSHLRVAICRLFRLATIRVNRSDAALHSALTRACGLCTTAGFARPMTLERTSKLSPLCRVHDQCRPMRRRSTGASHAYAGPALLSSSMKTRVHVRCHTRFAQAKLPQASAVVALRRTCTQLRKRRS